MAFLFGALLEISIGPLTVKRSFRLPTCEEDTLLRWSSPWVVVFTASFSVEIGFEANWMSGIETFVGYRLFFMTTIWKLSSRSFCALRSLREFVDRWSGLWLSC